MNTVIQELLAKLQIASRQAENGSEDARKRALAYIDLLLIELGGGVR